jgi:hypothetical protein
MVEVTSEEKDYPVECGGFRRSAGLACRRFWRSNHPANADKPQLLARISPVFEESELFHLSFTLSMTPMHTQTMTVVAHHPTHLR